MEQGMLKCDFHCHTSDDPYDPIWYSGKQLIDEYAQQNFDVVAITLHGRVHYPKSLVAYAKKKGILLIPGTEAFLGKKHILLLNFTEKERLKIKTTQDVRRIRKIKEKKKQPFLVAAAHPFYPAESCLNEILVKNPDCFDAIEYSHFYIPFWNKYNKKAVAFAKSRNKPIIGTGDVHHFSQLGMTYTLVKSKKTAKDVFAAIRKGKCSVVSRPLPFLRFIKATLFIFPYSAIARKKGKKAFP